MGKLLRDDSVALPVAVYLIGDLIDAWAEAAGGREVLVADPEKAGLLMKADHFLQAHRRG